MSRWLEVGPDNYVLTTQGSLLNTGLVVGTERAMVIDTGGGPRQGREILAAVREKTGLPLVVVNTHAHYDHFFGNAVFADDGVTEFWAHENCAAEIEENGDEQRRLVASAEPEMAAGQGSDAELVVPNAIVKDQPVLVDLGGQTATLFYLGRGHTDGDLLVGTASTLFAGDLVEQGSHPSFEDSFPEDWADALRHLSALRHRYEFLIPGHGEPCSRPVRQDHGQHHDHRGPAGDPGHPGNPGRRHQGHPDPAVRARTVALVHQAPAGHAGPPLRTAGSGRAGWTTPVACE